MRSEIETRSGRLRGRDKGVLVFRGIPFAKPPVGERRFRAPEPPEPWTGVRDATAFGPAVPQSTPEGLCFGPGLDAGPQDEDCLYLDICTPGTVSRHRPVLAWIHGGDFTRGAGSEPVFDGRALAGRGDAVVVTIDYRRGALGFLYLDELGGEALGAAANPGLLDQLAALEWVRDHIAALGGDPGNVTVFGALAGATSIAALMAMPRAWGLFHKAILQSGGAPELQTRRDATVVAVEFLTELGRVPREVAALWKTAADELLQAEGRVLERLASPVLSPFRPVLDSQVIPESPVAAIRRGLASDIPLLVGTSRDQCRLHHPTDPREERLDERALLARVAEMAPGADAKRLVAAYTRARSGKAPVDPRSLWSAIETDGHFRLPAIRLAEAQAAHQPRTYMYLFTWEWPGFGGGLDTGYGLEAPFVFGSLGGLKGSGPPAERLSCRVMDAWLAFARTGDPNHEGFERWPAYETKRRETMILDRECRVESDPEGTLRRAWEPPRPRRSARQPRAPVRGRWETH